MLKQALASLIKDMLVITHNHACHKLSFDCFGSDIVGLVYVVLMTWLFAFILQAAL